MKIKYKFITGETTEVEVQEDVGSLIVESRRIESNLNRKERYHAGYYIDGDDSGIEKLIDSRTPETYMLEKNLSQHLSSALSHLTKTQRRRLLMFAEGLSMREIARCEGVDHKAVKDSIEQARKKIKNFL